MPKTIEENSDPIGDQILVEVHFLTKLPDCTCCLKTEVLQRIGTKIGSKLFHNSKAISLEKQTPII